MLKINLIGDRQTWITSRRLWALARKVDMEIMWAKAPSVVTFDFDKIERRILARIAAGEAVVPTVHSGRITTGRSNVVEIAVYNINQDGKPIRGLMRIDYEPPL